MKLEKPVRTYSGTLPWWRTLTDAAVILAAGSVVDIVMQLVVYGRVHW